MQDKLRKILKLLGPEVTRYVSSNFGVVKNVAGKVLPTVAPLVAFHLSEQLEHSQPVNLLQKDSRRFWEKIVNIRSAFKVEPVDHDMLIDIFGDNCEQIVRNLARNLQVKEKQAEKILFSIAIVVLSVFQNEA